jgi:hypothetical protein
MRRIYRREKQQFLFGAGVGVVGILSLLFFLILYLPTRAEYLSAGETIERLERETVTRRQRLAELQSTLDGLDGARTNRAAFLTERLISREAGFAAMIPDLERLAGIAGVDRTRATYSISEEPQFGLFAVTINMPFQDTYGGLTRFIEELEGAETFFILDSIALRRTQADRPDSLDLNLNLTTFFTEGP